MEKSKENTVLDFMDNKSYENMSCDELKFKINTFRNLCLGNKINTSNAFDIDMIGYFATWIKKKKDTDNNVELFQDIADYLDASGKVYCCRVDNLCESTFKLVEQFREVNFKKAILNTDNEQELLKMTKPKRRKMMLTTSEKLNCKLTETNNFVDPSIKQGIINFDFNELFEYHRPADYMISLYNNYSLEEEKQKLKDKKSQELESDIDFSFSLPDLSNSVICPHFHNFVAKNDKVLEEEEQVMEGIENCFDPDNNAFQNSISDDESNVEIDLNLNDKSKTENKGLLECIDNVNRDYSFFNPKLLANWKGPKAWKAQAMAKALKSCKSKEPNEEIKEFTQENSKSRKRKYHTTKNENKVKFIWRPMNEIHKSIKVKSKEILLPYTFKKWDSCRNIIDTKTIVDIKHKYEFLEYKEILPDWWTPKKSINTVLGENFSALSPNYQEDCEYTAVVDAEEEFLEANESESDDDILKEFKNESRMNIGDLKKEILKIIDQECVKIDTDDEWSIGLLYSNLLNKLKVNGQQGYTEAMVFVGFLHLVNEQGLKLHQEPSTLNNIKDITIYKPIKMYE